MKKVYSIMKQVILLFALVFAGQWLSAQIVLPYNQGFESASGTLTANTTGISGITEFDYTRSAAGGRLRFQAGAGFYHTGSAAATLDRDPSGSFVQNYLILNLDLSNYTGANNLEFSFWWSHHGEEAHTGDRVWVRDSPTSTWVQIYNQSTSGTGGRFGPSGQWNFSGALDLDQILTGAGQSLTSTVQIRFGQNDNFPASSTTASDGFTVDDIRIEQIKANDGGVSRLSPFCAGLAPVEVDLSNYGNDTIKTATINWSVNGAVQSSANLTGLSIPKGQSASVNIGNFNFVTGANYSFSIYTDSINGIVDEQRPNDTLNVDASNALSGVYTVGVGLDYSTIDSAWLAMMTNSICGPVELHLSAADTFSESVTLTRMIGLSSTNNIRITSDPNNTTSPVVVGSFTVGDVAHVKMDHLHMISNTNTINLSGVNDSITIDSCILESSSTGFNVSVIRDQNTPTMNTTNLRITNNEIIGGYNGIFIDGDWRPRNERDVNIWIEGNSISDCIFYGIRSEYILNMYIRNNDITMGSAPRNATRTQYGISVDNGNNFEISNNSILGVGSGTQEGIRLTNGNRYNKVAADSIWVINNLVSLVNTTSTNRAYGLNMNYHSGTKVYHNSVYVNTLSGTSTALLDVNNRNFGSETVNNIFENGGSGNSARITSDASGGNKYRDFNGFWAGDTGVANSGATGFTILPNSYVANPRFKDATTLDMRVNATEYDSTASNVGILVDASGASRNIPFHDIGALEFTPCPTDAAVSSITTDYNMIPAGQSVYHRTTVKNAGYEPTLTTALNSSATSILLGTLGVNQDTTLNVLTPLPAPGNVSVEYYTTISGNDCFTENDTLDYEVMVSDSVYGNDDSTSVGSLGFTGAVGEFGTVFEVFAADKITSGTFYLNSLTTRGASVRLKLYEFSDTAGVLGVLDSTRTVQIGANGEGWYTLEFGCGGIQLQPGKYFVSVDQANPVNMSLGYGNIVSRENTRFYNSGAGWIDFTTLADPNLQIANLLLRANFGEIGAKSVLADTTVMCFGSSAQVIPLNEYSFYTWSTGEFFDSIKVVAPGVISIRVEDAIGCEYFDTTLVVRASQIMVTANSTRATCDQADGMVTLSATGQYGPYSFDWGQGVMGDTLTGLSGDVYKVTAIDAIGCREDIDVEVLGATPQVTASAYYPTCFGDNDGSIEVNVDKGIPNYSYAWSSSTGNSSVESGLSSGSYSVTVTDKSNCPNVMTVVVNNPPRIGVVVQNDAPSACKMADGSVKMNVNGGITPFTYSWSNGQNTAKAIGLTEGIYDVTITDSLGCVNTRRVQVYDPNSPISVPTNFAVDCHDDTATAKVVVNGGTGPFNYNWSTGSTAIELNGVKSGVYNLRIEDALGCDHDTMVIITAPDPLLVSISNVIDNGEDSVSATANAVGGTKPYVNFLWSNGETDSTATRLPNGTNTVKVIDVNGCSYSTRIDVRSEFTGLSDLEVGNKYRVYPNPTVGVVNIEFNLTSSEDVTVKVMNAVGEVVEVLEQSSVSAETLTVDLTGYSSGIYFIESTVGEEKAVDRIQLSK